MKEKKEKERRGSKKERRRRKKAAAKRTCKKFHSVKNQTLTSAQHLYFEGTLISALFISKQ